MQVYAKYIVLTGVIIVVIGLIFMFFGDKLHWLGKLPGDIRIENENMKFYAPITTMMMISILLSLLLFFLRKFF
jgi:hypothetical protein